LGFGVDAAIASGFGPASAYAARLASGGLRPDPAQAAAVASLDALWHALRDYDPRPKAPQPGLFGRLFRRAPEPPPPPLGLYLVGDVGRGKSMLMDMFFDTAEITRKRRIHFHRFMRDCHASVHAWRRANPDGADPIPPLADRILEEAELLCFDEFQVTNIADAIILGRLFEALFARGVVVVATSNVAPDDLFKGQPGRDAFLPFIEILKRHVTVLTVDGPSDYRRRRLLGRRIWHVPPDGMARRALDEVFAMLTDNAEPEAVTLTVTGRRLLAPVTAKGVARFDFQALCGVALGAGDYLAIAAAFHTVMIDAIPRLSPDNYDEARRFITLIDTLYDQQVKLIASAEAMPDQLYRYGENAKMFERTASRLDEMRSEAWLDAPHRGQEMDGRG
jgi:cell division protein ZapE